LLADIAFVVLRRLSPPGVLAPLIPFRLDDPQFKAYHDIDGPEFDRSG
jgi:hypothetical protein